MSSIWSMVPFGAGARVPVAPSDHTTDARRVSRVRSDRTNIFAGLIPASAANLRAPTGGLMFQDNLRARMPGSRPDFAPRHRRLQPLGHPQGRVAAGQHDPALPGPAGADGLQPGARLALRRDPGPGRARGGDADPRLHLLPRLLPRLVLRLATGQPHHGLPDGHPHLHALRRLEAQPHRPSRHRRRPGRPRHRRHLDHDRGRSTWPRRAASAWATGWCATRSSCCWWCPSGCR